MFRDKEGRTLQMIQLPITSAGVTRIEPSFVAYRDFEWTPRHQVVSTKTGIGTSFVTLFHMSKSNTRVTFSHVTETDSAYVVTYSLSDGRSRTIEMPKGELDVPEEEIEIVEE